MPKGRKKRSFGGVITGHALGPDGKPLHPDKVLAPSEHKLFVGTRTREIAVEMLRSKGLMLDENRLTKEALAMDLTDLWYEAQDRATAELTQAIRNKKPLFRKAGVAPGRPPNSKSAKGPDAATLLREYLAARPKFRTSGLAITAVAEHLWRTKYKMQGLSSQAVAKRIQRALKNRDKNFPRNRRS